MKIFPIQKSAARVTTKDQTIATFYYRCDLPDGRILWGDLQNGFWGEQHPPQDFLTSSWYSVKGTLCDGWDNTKAVRLAQPKVFVTGRMVD